MRSKGSTPKVPPKDHRRKTSIATTLPKLRTKIGKSEGTHLKIVRISMLWPSPQDYNEAIQNPNICFTDSDLKSARVALGPLGLPHPITGAFSSVYRLESDFQDRAWAVRCFLRPVSDQQQRYAHISKSNLAETDCLVGFRYIDQGIRVGGVSTHFPIVKMDWIDGETLDRYIARNLKSPLMLFLLLESFFSILDQLQLSGVAHGDLQHGNILVSQDTIKLVDYDNMFVPALIGARSNELGHRNYQHPNRDEHFGPHLDRFSAWVIATSIACVACDPNLWIELDGGDECLLFRATDFKSPDASKAFTLLADHRMDLVRNLAAKIRKFAASGIDDVPPVSALEIRSLITSSGVATAPIILPAQIARSALTMATKSLPTSQKVVQRSVDRAKAWSDSTIRSFLSLFVGIPAQAMQHIRSGDDVFSRGDYLKAKEHYLNALNMTETQLLDMIAMEPEYPWSPINSKCSALRPVKWQEPLILLLGMCYAHMHKWRESTQCLRLCINTHARSGDARLHSLSSLLQASVLLASGKKEQAIHTITRNSEGPHAYARKNQQYNVRQAALACKSKLLKPLKDEVCTFMIALGDSISPNPNEEGADKQSTALCYKAAYELDVEKPDALMRLGCLEAKLGNRLYAYEYFKHAHELSKTVSAIQISGLAMWIMSVNPGLVLKELLDSPVFGRRCELDANYADGSVLQVLAEQPEFLQAMDAWSLHLLKNSRFDDVAGLVSIALKVAPRQTAPSVPEILLRFNLGLAHWLDGRPTLAQAIFKESVSRLASNLPYRVPYHALASMCLAAISFELGKEVESKRLVKEWAQRTEHAGFNFKIWVEEGGEELLRRIGALGLSERLHALAMNADEAIPSTSLIMKLIASARAYSGWA